MADFQIDFNITSCNSLQIVLYQHGSFVQARTLDMLKETISSENNSENSDAEV